VFFGHLDRAGHAALVEVMPPPGTRLESRGGPINSCIGWFLW
jgi:hypothetical protein